MGKAMLAWCVSTVLPAMTLAEGLESIRLHEAVTCVSDRHHIAVW
jgi:predicted ATPase with chaperone activity